MADDKAADPDLIGPQGDDTMDSTSEAQLTGPELPLEPVVHIANPTGLGVRFQQNTGEPTGEGEGTVTETRPARTPYEIEQEDVTEEELQEYDRIVEKQLAFEKGRGEEPTLQEVLTMHTLAVRIRVDEKSRLLDNTAERVRRIINSMDELGMKVESIDKDNQARYNALHENQKAFKEALNTTLEGMKKPWQEMSKDQKGIKQELEKSRASALETREQLKKMGEKLDTIVKGNVKGDVKTKVSEPKKEEPKEGDDAAKKDDEVPGEDDEVVYLKTVVRNGTGKEAKDDKSKIRAVASIREGAGNDSSEIAESKRKKEDVDREHERKNLVKWPPARLIEDTIAAGNDPAKIEWKTDQPKELKHATVHIKSLKGNEEYTAEQIRELMTIVSSHAVKDSLAGETIMNFVRTQLKGDAFALIDTLRDEHGVKDEELWYQIQRSGGRVKSTADASKELINLITTPDSLTFRQVSTKIPQLVKYKAGAVGQTDMDKLWQARQCLDATHTFLTLHVKSALALADISEYYAEASKKLRDAEVGVEPFSPNIYIRFCNKVMDIPSIKDYTFKTKGGSENQKVAGMTNGNQEQQPGSNGKTSGHQVAGMTQGGAGLGNVGGAPHQSGFFQAQRPWGQTNQGQSYSNGGGGGFMQPRQPQPRVAGGQAPLPPMVNGANVPRTPGPPFPGNGFQTRFNGPAQGSQAFGASAGGGNGAAPYPPIPNLPWAELSKLDQGRCFPLSLKHCCWNCGAGAPNGHPHFRCPHHPGAVPKDPRIPGNLACVRCNGYHPGPCHLEGQAGPHPA